MLALRFPRYEPSELAYVASSLTKRTTPPTGRASPRAPRARMPASAGTGERERCRDRRADCWICRCRVDHGELPVLSNRERRISIRPAEVEVERRIDGLLARGSKPSILRSTSTSAGRMEMMVCWPGALLLAKK